MSSKNRILICGIPGTGKTTIGDYLEKDMGFYHYDVEANQSLPDLNRLPEKAVITWGFSVPPGSLRACLVRSRTPAQKSATTIIHPFFKRKFQLQKKASTAV